MAPLFSWLELPPLSPEEHRAVLAQGFPRLAPRVRERWVGGCLVLRRICLLYGSDVSISPLPTLWTKRGRSPQRSQTPHTTHHHPKTSLLTIESLLGSKEEGEDLTLSTRQLTRLARRLASSPSESAALARIPRLVHETLLTAFAPTHVGEVVNDVLRRAGLPSSVMEGTTDDDGTTPLTINATSPTHLSIGGVTVPKRRARRPELVPRPWPYHDTPQQTRLLQQLLQDYAAGERAVLLVGNQVGNLLWIVILWLLM